MKLENVILHRGLAEYETTQQTKKQTNKHLHHADKRLSTWGSFSYLSSECDDRRCVTPT